MIEKFNFHTHTVFCDGKSTAREIVITALEKNLRHLGFSGHSFNPTDTDFCMSLENTEKYKAEVMSLKSEFKDKINIYLGIEQDFYSSEPTDDYEFVIGSVHSVFKGGEYLSVDESEKAALNNISSHYGGNAYKYCEDYYKNVAEIYKKTHCGIVGHFDLITKFNECGKMFDESDKRYISAYKSALSELLKEDVIFEINSGAVSRGYRFSPYPSLSILRDIFIGGGKITLSSDSHDKSTVDFGFYESIEYAKSCGFKEVYYLTPDGFKAQKI